jgi:hypothetical protein
LLNEHFLWQARLRRLLPGLKLKPVASVSQVEPQLQAPDQQHQLDWVTRFFEQGLDR